MINPARCLTLVAVTAVAIGGGWAAPLAAHADVSVYSYVTVISDAGEYVGGGVRTEMWTPGGGSITLDNNTTKVVIRAIDKANRSYAFTFAGPDGERLAVGSYPAAQQAWSPTSITPTAASSTGCGCTTRSVARMATARSPARSPSTNRRRIRAW